MATDVSVEAKGFSELSIAMRGLSQDIRTEKNKEFRQAAKQTAQSVVIPELHKAAMSGKAPPQARHVAATARPQSDRWPKVKVGGVARNFRKKRPKGPRGGTKDAPRIGAIFWGSITNRLENPRFGPDSGDLWIGAAIRKGQGKAAAIHRQFLARALKREGLI